MATKYIVATRDVDGGGRRTYSTRDGAAKRFREMSGLTFEQAIADHYYDVATPPTADTVMRLRAVSMYGTVVTFQAVEGA